MDTSQRDKIRHELIVEVYRGVDADTSQPIDFREIGNGLQFDSNEIRKAYRYFLDEGLIECYGSGYTVVITHFGIKMVESWFRKINFNEDIGFSSIEIFQLSTMLNEIKEQINILHQGQEILYNQIDDAVELSKVKTKSDWRDYFEEQIKDWMAQKVIDYSAQIILSGLLTGNLSK